MSIIKSILHKYNATSKAYDTLHPETESAQVTDWNQGIVNTLASTALGGLVNTLTSDSLLAKMIQKVLTATGVKYNIDQNGYICFGSLFGGLIIQWGITTDNGWGKDYWTFTYPIAMSSSLSACLLRSNGGGNYSVILKDLGSSELHWTDAGVDGKHGYGDTMYAIILGH